MNSANLGDLVNARIEELMGQWRIRVRNLPTAAHLDAPTLTDMMPKVLKELASALRSGAKLAAVDAYLSDAPAEHGLDRLEKGFHIDEVITEYAIMQDLVLDLAVRGRIDLAGDPMHVITRFFARSMATAAKIYVGNTPRQ